MRRWMVALPLSAAAVALAVCGDPTFVLAQPPAAEEVQFRTADGVRLKGLFHASTKNPAGDPVVMLLYPPGPGNNMTKGDWDGLSKTLTDNGYSVLRFDWRGHGKSTDIEDTDLFWNNPITGSNWNRRYVKHARPAGGKTPIKSDLQAKADFDPKYFPVYVNDIAAARQYLDQRNDNGKANTSSIYVIGAGDAAALGMLWLTAEWLRPAVYPNVNQLGGAAKYEYVPQPLVQPVAGKIEEAGRDVAGVVWLSAGRPATTTEFVVKKWPLQSPRMREMNHTLFLYGGDDDKAATQSKFFYNEVLVAKGNKGLGVKELEQTFLTAVPKTKLSGVALLGKNAEIGTEDTILKYLAARKKDRGDKVVVTRGYTNGYYINPGSFYLQP